MGSTRISKVIPKAVQKEIIQHLSYPFLYGNNSFVDEDLKTRFESENIQLAEFTCNLSSESELKLQGFPDVSTEHQCLWSTLAGSIVDAPVLIRW